MAVDVRMWGRALTRMPKIDKERWDGLDRVSRWLIATRSAVLIMTFLSAGIAGIFAYRAGAFDGLLWGLVVLGLLAAHATNNLLNDLTDHLKGVDKGNYFRTQYGPQPVEHGFMTVRQMLVYAGATGLVALAAGATLVVLRGELVLVLMAAGAFFVLLYTWPLKYIGLGEPAVLVVWGPLMIGGSYYVLTAVWSWNVVIASLPYALGVTTVLFGKHIDKIKFDTERRIHTLPVLLGDAGARYTAMALVLAQYALVTYLVAIGFFSPAPLIIVGALPMLKYFLQVYKDPPPKEPPPEYPKEAWPMWYVSFAFVHNRRFGLLFLLGLIADALLIRFDLLGG